MNLTDHDVLEWDVKTWSAALRHWEKSVAAESITGQPGLEIGAGNGGLSLFFAVRFGAQMTCSDVREIPLAVRDDHRKRGVADQMVYEHADATRLPFEDESFSFVVCRSVFGVIGSIQRNHEIVKAVSEIHRVLRPGGRLFFAENLQGSALHQLARRLFVDWGTRWNYQTRPELDALFSRFSSSELETTGFLSAFVRSPHRLKDMVCAIDSRLQSVIPESWRYVCYGIIRK